VTTPAAPGGRSDVDLSGRVAVVTGGSRGLGRAMSLAFAAHGATVVVASRKPEGCEAVVAEIEERGGTALAVPTHVGRWADCDRLCDTVYERLGRADVLVNNAGMSPAYEDLADVTEELFDKVVGVNLRGPFRLAIRFGRRMGAAGGTGGSIINVSSVSAVQPGPHDLAYAAAKSGLVTMTLGLARAFGPTVRANAIMPGMFLTDMAKAWDPETYAATTREHVVMARGGEPQEIVGAALYLASDLSSYTTGAVIKVDGGYAHAAA
jgi:NAD(P)-dependent dehydrogenase (short-subunit alcohol dehydrogenase family)